MKDQYRALTDEEILKLEGNNCSCDNWSRVVVKKGFDPRYVRNSLFSGNVQLGVFSTSFDLEGGLQKHTGIYNATIHNCTIGDQVLIENIHNYLANYNVGDGAFIQNVNTLVVTERSSFGNGTPVAVLDETGGREVLIYDDMSSHFAYAYCLYRYRTDLIDAMKNIVLAHAERVSSDRGTIGKHVFIKNAGSIKNVRIGDYCCIEGASRLTNGSIISNQLAPVYIGCEVVATDFIISSGSSVDESTILSRCFIGQACKLGHSYSASDSLFFSNCQGENGEACSVFAGPYTVTHHKSTLLIAGMFSFINAGSGSNQSNHMYKLGPVHQGIVERGAKTTSNSYVLWPAHVGAFTLIMGRHYKHLNTSSLPFSYIVERDDESYLAPAINIRTVGTTRDFRKWSKRDARKDPHVLDQINFSLYNPFTIGKILQGIACLKMLREQQGYDTQLYNYNGCVIPKDALKRGINLYEMAVAKYFGDCVLHRFDHKLKVVSDSMLGVGNWVDLSGLIAPQSEVESIFSKIELNELTSTVELHNAFKQLHGKFEEYEWNWVYYNMRIYYNLDAMSEKEQMETILTPWLNASIELDQLICSDARKEFGRLSMVGFGMDGSIEDSYRDLSVVRGCFDENAFVLDLRKQTAEYQRTYDAFMKVKYRY